MLPAFDIDPRIPMRIDFDLAVRVGEFIVNSGTSDKQIMAFGHRLLALEQKPADTRKSLKARIGQEFFGEEIG